MLHIRPIVKTDQELVASIIEEHWGSRAIVSRGEMVDAATLPGFLAYEDEKLVGIITLRARTRPGSPERDKDGNCFTEWEVVSLDAFVPRRGIGRELLRHAESFAQTEGATNLWLITTRTGLKSGWVARNSMWERNEECERKNRRCILRDTLRIFSRSITKLQPQIEFRSSRDF